MANYQCYVCADFSVEQLRKSEFVFILDIVSFLAIVVAMILLVIIFMIRRFITGPINRMLKCARSFGFETEEDREQNIESLNGLNIHTGDEIEELYRASLYVIKDSLSHMQNLKKTKNDIRDKSE